MKVASKHTLNPTGWNTQHREYLIRFALQRVSDYGTAEDMVQEAFMSAWNARKRFRGDCTERTWLSGILRNKIIDHYRKTGRRPSVLSTDLDSSGFEDFDQTSWMERQPDSKTYDQPVAATERSEFMRHLESAVTNLPETMGTAFRMREMQGYSTDEITNVLKISRSNLWVLIHRAKQSLSEELSSNWVNTGEFGELKSA